MEKQRILGYARISTVSQNIDRQIIALKEGEYLRRTYILIVRPVRTLIVHSTRNY